ncbi:ParB/RepB/Spo0J family partition protein [Pseudomonas aeruginosa]|uniref:ParB/RepB/Spo0J family partition protein n=1 Tax=Pseudomonas aeruginosa TaxID=287 RepID=UPI00292BE9E3|nr:ParB N-terminal domain-containing protein [Pseudomonas aeruginosa]HEC0596081.1 ParB N-terminal domain-containing protein [Pseudomonas aeruginosa]HEC0962491.1 ParB N-terminal domain-containing protein [Pseudomonas aeruginosa]HEC1334528.1 ParB N-terminal domain-containing protein [Pseudomonas aeruginosa]HEC1341428.1 ParB N-terminal domain-containing protein [Pseudomonas aeruginosa]
MNNNAQKQQQKTAQGASSKARGKAKSAAASKLPGGVWKEIPLKKLRLWAKNVRVSAASTEAGDALEASLQSQGLLQNLVVIEAEDGFYDVAAGGRRLAKLHALVEKKKLSADTLIMCQIVDESTGLTASLSENVQREAMHPADEFIAFQELSNAGIPVADIAASFGVTPVVVKQRLKLANLSPRLIQAYREGSANMEQLQALAICDNHEIQEAAFFDVQSWMRQPYELRRAVTRGETLVRHEPLARFVGLEAYEQAGGAVRRDLFGNAEDSYITDLPLLDKLAIEKLEPIAEPIRAEGWGWVEVMPRFNTSDLYKFGRIHPLPVELTPEQQTERASLKAALDQLETEIENAFEAEDFDTAERLEQEKGDAEDRLHALESGAVRSYDPEAMTTAGCIISVGNSGDVEVRRGLVKPEDMAAVEGGEKQGTDGQSTDDAPKEQTARLPDRMGRQLTAHKTAALQVELARNPKVALVAVVHKLAIQIIHSDHSPRFAVPVGVSVSQRGGLTEYASDLKDSAVLQALEDMRGQWRERLPSEPRELFAALLDLSMADLNDLLAFCVATGVDVVSDKGTDGQSGADVLAQTLELDMRNWWKPTADAYFREVPKGLTLEAMQTIAPAEVARLSTLKKNDLAAEAGRLAEGSNWLPAILASHEPKA